MSTDIQERVQDHTDAESTGTMQLVSFHLAEETFGVEITKVREINLMCEITQVPQSPTVLPHCDSTEGPTDDQLAPLWVVFSVYWGQGGI